MKSPIIATGLALVASMATAQDSVLTVYTYDSFTSDWGPGPVVEDAFEAICDCDLQFIGAGDGAALLSRLFLEGERTEADVVLGLDTNLIAQARDMGFRIRLLGVARLTSDGLEQRMTPCLVPAESALGRLEGVLNAVVVEGDFVGQTVLTMGMAEATLANRVAGATKPGGSTARSAVNSKLDTSAVVSSEKIKYIGKVDDLEALPRSQTLLDDLSPSLGNPKANWKRNSSVLRKAQRDGYEIRDASMHRLNSGPDPTPKWPERKVGQSFLGAERNLLNNRGLQPSGPTHTYKPKGE